MSDLKYTTSLEKYKGIEVLCIESETHIYDRDMPSILEELDQTMFLPKRILYKGGKTYWQGRTPENEYLYAGSYADKQSAVKSIVLGNLDL